MTAIEHRELKGITIKNVVITNISTASIVASVMTTYFGLKTDILGIKNSQETETRLNNIRITVLESQIALLQKQIDAINPADFKKLTPSSTVLVLKTTASLLLGSILKR